MPTPTTIQAARRNGSVSPACFGDIRLNVNSVVDLLVGGADQNRHVAIRRNANCLLDMLAVAPWQITAGPHAGGLGGGARPPDQTNHMTLRVRGAGYHLRQDARGHLFQITGPGLPMLTPWAAPGTPAM